MNIQECNILNSLLLEPYINQRVLADNTGYSLGTVNKSIKKLIEQGYLSDEIELTSKAQEKMEQNKPQRAIILAAGLGMRMIPINTQTSKGLIKVKGETLIERLIKQLKFAGINEIYVVVGFMKEQYEFLIDEYGVVLVVNTEYSKKNNLHSLNLVLNKISNSYIIPCDIWCNKNPFNRYELYSWYMVNDNYDENGEVRVNRKGELVLSGKNSCGNKMIGIAYLLEEQAKYVRERIIHLCNSKSNDEKFWETALYNKEKMIVKARIVPAEEVVEINTFEQLRDIDNNSNDLASDAMMVISNTFGVTNKEIEDIRVLKKGMTNRSFFFSCNSKKYIMRIPGEGTDQLINREQEAAVYEAIKNKNICDDIFYINPKNGYKITAFLENARVCNPDDRNDLRRCMEKLRSFHEENLSVDHEFDLFKQIDFYESLWEGKSSIYKDYYKTKDNVFKLKEYIDAHVEKKVLTHIDAVPDNFLFVGEQDLRLIDWEYAGMQDPHVDIAMFCIYSLYNKQQVDELIDLYFIEGCRKEIRIKIYGYIAVCGLLWSNWCEYKRNLGVEFGEYSLKQYRYAKEFYRIVQRELMEEKTDE